MFSELKNMRKTRIKSLKYATRGQHLLAYQPLEDGEDK